jgi:hypothetical protein
VPREVAQQVAAGDPSRQRETLFGGGIVDRAIDFEEMPVEVGESDTIANQGRAPYQASSARIVAQPC